MCQKGEKLRRFLDIYGVKEAAFKRMVSSFKDNRNDLEIVKELASKLKKRDLGTVRRLMEHLIKH